MSNRTPNPLLEVHRFFRRGPVSAEGWSQLVAKDRGWESFYRDRWQHDKVVRSTHGVNCTGSCSWNVYVKDGIITWESQAVDYPSTGPDMPEYEPRGCPRGASFSWYTYSEVADPAERAALAAGPPRPWAFGEGVADRFLRIDLSFVSGRRFGR